MEDSDLLLENDSYHTTLSVSFWLLYALSRISAALLILALFDAEVFLDRSYEFSL
jgi:hypothetical protein